MNKVILIGRLTRDPESGNVTKFSLAVDRKYKKEGQPDADFINCKAFGKTGDFIAKYFTKGKRVAVDGRIQVSKYEEKYYTDVIVESAEFADGKKDEGFGEV